MTLRYDWHGALYRLKRQPPQGVDLDRLNAAYDFGAWFIERWADYAEMARIQPAHVLRYPGGLAWRWRDADVLCFPRERHLVAETPRGALFVYRFEPDGAVRHVFGAARAEILGAHVELEMGPTMVEVSRSCP